MILSSLITPVRIYSQFHELDKFTKNYSKFDRFELITDKTRLLPFQFIRTKSPYPIFKMWLRQECNNFYNEVLEYNIAHFLKPNEWSTSATSGISIGNGKAVFTAGTSDYITQPSLLTIGKSYRVKIVINQIVNDNTMALDVKNGTGFGNPSQSISAAGTHIFEFTAVDTAILIMSTITGSDYAHINEFSVYEISQLNDVANDYELDPTILEIKNTSTTNIITHCGDAFNNTLPCGKYYLIMQSKDASNNNAYYFSEVITIKDFVPTQSPLIFLEWYNTCDLENVKYTGLDCNYKNRMYVDHGVISRPEYPFDEVVQKNGENVDTPVFQKWEKSQRLSIPKASEFIVDAITAMKLHDTIKFYFPLRLNQQLIDLTNDVNTVESLTYEIDHIFNDSATNISLKILLADRLIDSSCCEEIVLADDCITCTHNLEGICVDSENAKICPKDGGLPGYDYYVWNGSSWVLTDPPTGTLLCFTDETPSLYFNGTTWIHVPVLSAFTNGSTTITVTGNIFLNTVCQIILTRGTYVYTVPNAYTPAQIAAGVVLNKADLPAILFSGGDLDVTIHNTAGACDYGYSNVMTLCYGDGC